jgi:Zn-dependent protease
MIPFPPLDGSRLLYAFAPEPLQRLMYQIESMGFLAILLFFVLIIQIPGFGVVFGTVMDKLIHLLLGGYYPI